VLVLPLCCVVLCCVVLQKRKFTENCTRLIKLPYCFFLLNVVVFVNDVDGIDVAVLLLLLNKMIVFVAVVICCYS